MKDEKIVEKLKKQAESNLRTYYSGARPVEVRAELLLRTCELAQAELAKEAASND
jgi:hypothetical protein